MPIGLVDKSSLCTNKPIPTDNHSLFDKFSMNFFPHSALKRSAWPIILSSCKTHLVLVLINSLNFSYLSLRSFPSIVTALWIACASSAVFAGWKLTLPPFMNTDAPANSERTRTPWRFSWQATYSKETRFMPSREEVSRHTSATEYIAVNSSKGMERCMYRRGEPSGVAFGC